MRKLRLLVVAVVLAVALVALTTGTASANQCTHSTTPWYSGGLYHRFIGGFLGWSDRYGWVHMHRIEDWYAGNYAGRGWHDVVCSTIA